MRWSILGSTLTRLEWRISALPRDIQKHPSHEAVQPRVHTQPQDLHRGRCMFMLSDTYHPHRHPSFQAPHPFLSQSSASSSSSATRSRRRVTTPNKSARPSHLPSTIKPASFHHRLARVVARTIVAQHALPLKRPPTLSGRPPVALPFSLILSHYPALAQRHREV
jgi:hypothetical protein